MTEIVISQERADTEGIVKSAQRLLEKYGYRRMTMDDLAREVGMSKGALYLRFATKEDVAVACIERFHRDLVDALEAIEQGPGDPGERLEQVLVARIMMRIDKARTYCESYDEVYASIKPLLGERKARFYQIEAEIVQRLLVECGNDPARSAEDAEMLVLATNSLSPYSLTPNELQDREAFHLRALHLAQFLLRSYARKSNS